MLERVARVPRRLERQRTSSRRGLWFPALACFASFYACQSSSASRSSGPLDGGRSEASTASDASGEAADGALSCTPFAAPTCARGQVCCLSPDFSGECTDFGACGSNAQFECRGADDCDTGEHCCVTLVDGTDAGPSAQALCAAECAAPSRQTCETGEECPAGSRCVLLPEGGSGPLLALVAEAYKSLCGEADGGTRP